MLAIHLRINDADTGRPTPVRVRVSGLDGVEFAPMGCHLEFPTGRNEDVGGHALIGRERWYHIDGACEIRLPANVPISFEATKGPEYLPLREIITLGPGQMSVRLVIRRWVNLATEGWRSGDTRCHFLTPHAALREAAAEGLNYVDLLATETFIAGQDGKLRPVVPNLLAFSGQKPCLEESGVVVAVNTHNVHPVLGSLGLIHCHRPVFPLLSGGAEASDDWTLDDWCHQCHRKRGLVIWTDSTESVIPGPAPEALALVVLGEIDAIEMTPSSRRLRDCYRIWTAGIRVPLVGASAKENNRTVLGMMRTYAHMSAEGPFAYGAWIDALRAGATFVTNGPVIEFSADGQPPGARLDRTAGKVSLFARARSAQPMEALEILANGEVIGRVNGHESDVPYQLELRLDHPIDGGTWFAARCPAPLSSQGFAHSSPVFVTIDGNGPADEAAILQLNDVLERAIDWVNRVGRFDKSSNRDGLLERLNQARLILRGEAGRERDA